jgi:hypothetical protein
MPKIFSYRKVTDKYTTYTAVDSGEEDKRITELCVINGNTYISVPNNFVLPEQPKEITLKLVALTIKLKKQIKEKSPYIQLIEERVRERIRKKYKLEDELKIIRNKINGKELLEYTEYNKYVEECIIGGNLEKDKLL